MEGWWWADKGCSGTPLQYSCLENPMDGGAWWAAIYGVAQSRTWLKQLSSSSSIWNHIPARNDLIQGPSWWWYCTCNSLGICSFPGWTTKNLCAAGCSQKRQTDKKPNCYLDWRPKRGNHFTDFWDMKAFSHPDFTAKNYKILYRRTCEWKRKKWHGNQKKRRKTKQKIILLFHLKIERINWRSEQKTFLRQGAT